jgi:Domain of Unknown Function with PDB structure (DUF3857)
VARPLADRSLGSSHRWLGRSTPVFWLVIPLIWTSVFCGPASAQIQPVTPEELKMTSEPQAPGASAIVLYRQVDRNDNDRLAPREDDYFRIKILKEEGRKYGDVEIPFRKGNGDIEHVSGRTIRPDGSIAPFDGKVFEKYVMKGRGMKVLVKTFTLPEVEVGSIIEYSYSVDLQKGFVYDSHWILSNELFTKNARFTLKPYTSSYGDFRIRWSWENLPPGAVPKQGMDGIVRMEANNIPAFQTEDFMPPEDELKSRVDFIYEKGPPFEQDPAKFWKNFGKERNAQLEAFVGKKKAMEAAVGEIVAPTDPPEVKLRKIYDRVQQFRNTSYELRKTEQEEKRDREKQAENVEDVWKRGYGDGNQLTWLFLGLVRAAGFDAWGCWVSNRSNYFFDPKLMQPYKLDSNVVQVKLNGKDLFFDPGAAFTPFGLLTWAETGTPGLRLDKDGGTWMVTTLPESSESRIERTAQLKLSEEGDLTGRVIIHYVGLEAMYRRLEERNADEVAREKFLEDEAEEQVPVATQTELTNKPDWTSSETPLVAEFNIKIPGWCSGAGKRALFPVGVFAASEKHIFEHADRVHPIYFEYPFEKLDDTTIELPSGWKVSSLPPAQVQDGHVVSYSLKVEDKQSTLHLTRTLNVDFLLLEQKYYSALRNFFQVVRTGDEEQIVLQPGTAAASN